MSWIRLTRDAIDPVRLVAEVGASGHGATSLFVGTVRDTNDGRAVDGIEYSAYEAMAMGELSRIVAEAEARHAGIAIAVAHRLGALSVGDVSVAVACGHARRAHALDACREVIEQLKVRVPIWKRERYRDGTREWVDPTRARAGAAP